MDSVISQAEILKTFVLHKTFRDIFLHFFDIWMVQFDIMSTNCLFLIYNASIHSGNIHQEENSSHFSDRYPFAGFCRWILELEHLHE